MSSAPGFVPFQRHTIGDTRTAAETREAERMRDEARDAAEAQP